MRFPFFFCIPHLFPHFFTFAVMITVSNVSVYFSGEALFSKLAFFINPKDRIGLVGKNGAGKSTLLKLLIGELSPESGQILNPSKASIGYLPQEMIVESELSVIDEVNNAFSEANEVEEQIERITTEISERTDYESDEYSNLVEKLNEYNDRFLVLGGDTRTAEIEKVLLGLGFDRYEFDKSVNTLSGGWKMRVELAKLLLRHPDLILLDEPTNHLDILSIQWLETFLSSYSGSVMIVSHDRAFLDTVTNRTIEITLGRIFDYKCSYTEYVSQREHNMSAQLAAYDHQQREIQEIEKFVERFRYKATKAKQVQSRIKRLDKMDRISVDESDKSQIHFAFPPAPRAGKVIFQATELSKKFGDKLVLDKIDISVLRNDFVAFVGKNGMGKTTLSRIIIDELEHDGGVKELGHNVKIGYYAQNQAQMLDGEKTAFQTIDDVAVGDMRPRVRGILGSFLFSGEAIEKKVKVLSGGEKARLALAKMLLEPVNLLVLDEPTNHLDMQSKDILKSALLRYDGTLILVSHDRDFLQGLTNKVFEFRDHKVFEHIGDVYSFLEDRKIQQLTELEKGNKDGTKQKSLTDNKKVYEQRKLVEKERRKIRSKIETTETNIEKLELELEEIKTLLSNPKPDDDNSELYIKYNEVQKMLERDMEDWERLQNDLNKIVDE